MMIRKLLPLVLISVAACKTAPEVKAGPPPTLSDQELSVQQELTDFKVTLTGKAQSQAAARLEKATYELVVEGKVVKTGETTLNIDIPAGGSADFSVSDGAKYLSTAEELKSYNEKGGSLLSALRGKLHVTSGGAKHEIEFAKSKEIRVPRLPRVTMNQAEGARFSDEEVNVTFFIGVENPNPFHLPIVSLDYEANIAGKKLEEGKRGGGEKVSPSSTGVFELQLAFTKETYGADVKKLIKTNTLPYVVKGTLKGDLYELPYELTGDLKLNVSK